MLAICNTEIERDTTYLTIELNLKKDRNRSYISLAHYSRNTKYINKLCIIKFNIF